MKDNIRKISKEELAGLGHPDIPYEVMLFLLHGGSEDTAMQMIRELNEL